MNDFISLFTSFYIINSVEFIVMGYLLFIASIVAVSLNKIQKDNKINSQASFLKLFNYFSSFLNYSFLRKQNLNEQNMYNSNIRIFKKKK